MCDEGRFGWKYVHADERLTVPELKERDGSLISRDWDVVLAAARRSLEAASRERGIAAVFSPWMTLEEAYLLASYLKSLDPNTALALGPVRSVGEDDHYPKDVRGHSVDPARFTIRAEKCPNRRGVEIILRHFAAGGTTLGDVLGRAAAGDVSAMYCVGGDPQGWIGEEQAAALAQPSAVVVQDIFPSAATRQATIVLAAGTFAERDGSFVNHAGLAQEIRRAIRGPGNSRPDGRILWELAGRRGLFNLPALRREMAQTISELAALEAGQFGEQGIRLPVGDGVIAT
jgi:NADH-quinone oxidoreductase subunit G